MADKDRFGDKLRDKQKADEDRFFAEQDRARLEKLREQSGQAAETAAAETAKGRCPRCGSSLVAKKLDEVEIDECTSGHGVWLDAGELEALSRRDSQGWLRRFLAPKS